MPPNPKAQRNFTDPESRIMPAPGAKGSFLQGYNCQAAVDATAQIIIAADVTDEPNDKQQAQPRRGGGASWPTAGDLVGGRAGMRRTLRTKRGRARYAQRKAIVERVFGQIKQGSGFRQFLLRGMRKVHGEWTLICTTHNVLKLWTALRRRRRRPGEGLRTLSGNRKAKRRAQG